MTMRRRGRIIDTRTAAANGHPRRLTIRQLSDVQSRSIRFLVDGLLPLRTFTLVAGVGGHGKSTLAAAWAAGVTTGHYGDQPAGVLVVSYEDTAEEIWRPRLLAANGDPEQVGFVTVAADDGGMVVLPEDLAELEHAIRERNVRLVVVDPIVAAIDTTLDAHKDQHVRSVLGALRTLAEDVDAAVAGIGHLNKTNSKEAYVRVANSVAFWNAARSVILVTPDGDDDDHRLVSQMKANWARRRPPERWLMESIVLPDEIDAETGRPIETARMTFVETADDVDRDGVLNDHRGHGNNKTEHAAGLLEQLLADGDWHEKTGLVKLAGAHKISERTLVRAAASLGVESEVRGFPASAWWRLRRGS